MLTNGDEDLKLKIRNKELEVIQKTKYLGVTIENSLKWTEHIKTASTKVFKAIGFLRDSKTFLPQETLKTLYKGILSHTFGTVALSGVALARMSLISCKNFITELQGSQQTVALTPLADYLLTGWAGRPLISLRLKNRKQWSISPCMKWLHHTSVISLQKT